MDEHTHMTTSQDATLSNASTNTHTNSSSNTKTKWNLHDTQWTLSLFGTAVGAGILFLPINIGIGGFWPLIIMACLAFPMTFFAHRGLARFVLSSKNKDADFPSRGSLNIDAARKDFGYDPKVDVEEGFQKYYEWLSTSKYWQTKIPILNS